MISLESISKVESFGVGLVLGLILALAGVRGEVTQALVQSEWASRHALEAAIQLETTMKEFQPLATKLKTMYEEYLYHLRVKHGE